MVTGDPKRTPTMVLFGNDNFWLSSGIAPVAGSRASPSQRAGTRGTTAPSSAQINTTWLGMVGPGVAHLGIDNSVWSDHTNIQPTMMALLGLRDDYAPDGRVLGEIIDPGRAAGRACGRTAARCSAWARPTPSSRRRSGRSAWTRCAPPPGRWPATRRETRPTPGSRTSCSGSARERDAIGARMQALLLGAAFGGRHARTRGGAGADPGRRPAARPGRRAQRRAPRPVVVIGRSSGGWRDHGVLVAPLAPDPWSRTITPRKSQVIVRDHGGGQSM